jgi:hypothetical protein
MLTEAEILELETLVKKKEVDISRKKLCKIDEDTNPNYKLLKYNRRMAEKGLNVQ